jgi:formylglycine-generating enzyme required for sulfatase activity
VTLKPKPGMVDFATTPPGARVVINDVALKDGRTRTERATPFRGTLAPGDYTVRFELKGYKVATKTVTVKANRTVELAAALEKFRGPEKGRPWENALGMKFAPVPAINVLFGVWETRVRDYQAFAGETNRDWTKAGFAQGAKHPAVKVSWDDAKAFCAWLTAKERREGRLGPDQEYRLPTDAEWSAAVGLEPESGSTPQDKEGKIEGVYPWGTQWPPPRGAGNYADEEVKRGRYKSMTILGGYDDGFDATAPVGSFDANRCAIQDLGGNVWEWCEDYFNGRSGNRVLRGGSFGDGDRGSLLSSHRSSGTPGLRDDLVGFRCVLVTAGASAP